MTCWAVFCFIKCSRWLCSGRSQSCYYSHSDRSSIFKRHTSHFSSSHGIVTTYPTPNIYSTDVTHSTLKTEASLTPATPTTLHRKHSKEKQSYIQDPQPHINPTIQRLPSSRIPLQILHQFQTAILIL